MEVVGNEVRTLRMITYGEERRGARWGGRGEDWCQCNYLLKPIKIYETK